MWVMCDCNGSVETKCEVRQYIWSGIGIQPIPKTDGIYKLKIFIAKPGPAGSIVTFIVENDSNKNPIDD